ncbi:thioredoxin [Patescibacteria group bacterium]
MAVQVIKDADFEDKVLKSKIPVLVDFYADWCGPCKMAEPVLDELSDEYKDKVQIVKMNVDENTETPMKYGVMSIPTTVMISGGEEVGRQIGFAGREGFENVIKKVL